MRKECLLLILLLTCLNCFVRSQVIPDSILDRYATSSTDSGKGKLLYNYVRFSMPGTATEKLTVLTRQLAFFKNNNDVTGINYSYILIGALAWRSGENSLGLKFALSALRHFESVDDTTGILLALIEIGNSIATSQDPQQGLYYFKKGLSIAKHYNDKVLYSSFLNNTADYYIRVNRPDSAFNYIQDAVKINYELGNDILLCASIGTLGDVYLAKEEHEIARPFLKKSIDYCKAVSSSYNTAFELGKLSYSFFQTGEYDSAIVYARQTLLYAPADDKSDIMKAYETLYECFEKLGKQDSAFRYFRLSRVTRDSLYTIEKSRTIQFMHFQEHIRQQDLAIEMKKAEENRRQNIQYALVGVGIMTLIILYLLLSRSFITNFRVIEFLGALTLLLVFEFFNLLLHPFLEKVTHHSPLLMLLALVCIASILVPLHHRLEKWALNKLVENNKKVRLAAAKKTIEKLEKPHDNDRH